MCKKLIYLILFMLVLGPAQGQALGAYFAAYWDEDYKAQSENLAIEERDYFEAAGYEILDADQLKTWMDARIADGVASVVVMCNNNPPDTVAESMSDTCTIRKYLDAGGKVVHSAWNIPFWKVGDSDGNTTTWGAAGAINVLGFNAASSPRNSGDVVLTAAGIAWGLTETWQSKRATASDVTDNLTVLAEDAGGNAAAWVKHYLPGDNYRGFVRIRRENFDDVRRAAEFGTISLISASIPYPADRAEDVLRDVVLSWEPGEFAALVNGHKVYFGESFNDVNDAVGGVAQSATSYTLPQRLDFGTTYYWRVDEVDAALESTIFRGDVWSFTTEPVAYAIENVTATASSSNSPDEGPGNTISGSGLDADDLHSMEAPDMWLSSSEPLGAWIGYEFDKVYKLHQMWVWNSNQRTEPIVGFGVKDVTIEYSADGADWRELGGVHEFARAPGADGYAYNTIVDIGDVVAKYVKITANSNWGGIVSQYGLSEVRFFYIPVHAREPRPDSGATDVSIGTIDEPIDVTLGFRAGREAAKHDVYFSSEEQAVTDGTVPVTTVTEASYGPLPLDIGQTYYWRVDEVNEAEIPAMWQGDIWDFTTQEYFVVEDFEDYNDWPGYEIYTTWIDGYGVPTNGSEVAYPLPDFEAGEHYVETKIVHDGGQSAPFFYNNTAGVTYSEAKCIFDAPRDWTIRGIGSLSLWFRGYPAFVGSFVEEPAGSYTMTAYGADIWDQADEFHFAYQQLSGAGAIIAKVESLEQTHNWAKAGVMIRDTLDPNSAHAMMIVTPTQGLTFERRTSASQSTSRTRQAGITAPQWVKVERDIYGNVIASYSSDGNTWTELGGDVITMNTPMYIGLALTAHNAGAACEAKFSNVSTTGTVGAQWTNQDIGILSNDAAPMYVTLNGIATVYHDDPAVTQIDEWTPWPIDLQDFAAKGVDLTNVNTITIGFGDKNAPQTASGLVFFDDIRLYPLP